MILADLTADDDQVWPEECLQTLQEEIEALGPFSVGEAEFIADRRRGEFFCGDAVKRDVSQFRVRHQAPVVKEGRAKSGPNRNHDYGALVILSCPKMEFSDPGRVGIVDDGHL